MTMKNMAQNKAGQKGFTLVELSIVLVIIGLIVGGVLVGQALVAAAKVRAQLTQLDQFDAAINTFRTKYDCIPGDCANGVGYGLPGAAGNGNGLVDDGASGNTWAGELPVVWQQLSAQSLIPGSYDGGAFVLGTSAPASRLGLGGILMGYNGSSNYYTMAAFSTAVDYAAIIPAEAAFAIDQKRDDSKPGSGAVTAVTDGFAGTADVTVAGCTDADATNPVYRVAVQTAACALRVRVSG